MAERISVEVVYADELRQFVQRVELPLGSSVTLAIEDPAVLARLPPDVRIDHVGIFGRKVAMSRLLQDGDRIEIYRPLMLDPMAARRKRAR